MPTFDLSDQEIIDEVRSALAFLSDEEIPDDTLLYSVNRVAEPWVSDNASSSLSDQRYENAILTYGAELSFDAWYAKTQMGDSALQVSANPVHYKEKLQQRSDVAFRNANISRPPRMSHYQAVADPE